MRNSIKRVLFGLMGAAAFEINSSTAHTEPFIPTIDETVLYIKHHSTPPGDGEWIDSGFSIQNDRDLCMSYRWTPPGEGRKVLYVRCINVSQMAIDHISFWDAAANGFPNYSNKISIACVYQHNSLRDLCVHGSADGQSLDERDQHGMTLWGGSDVYRALVHLARMLNVQENGDFPPHF